MGRPIIFLLALIVCSGKVADWVNLECEENHKYLFSDITLNWQDSVTECQLYGGWLVSIGSLEEQNCLLRHGQNQSLDYWYWTDGRLLFNSCMYGLLINSSYQMILNMREYLFMPQLGLISVGFIPR